MNINENNNLQIPDDKNKTSNLPDLTNPNKIKNVSYEIFNKNGPTPDTHPRSPLPYTLNSQTNPAYLKTIKTVYDNALGKKTSSQESLPDLNAQSPSSPMAATTPSPPQSTNSPMAATTPSPSQSTPSKLRRLNSIESNSSSPQNPHSQALKLKPHRLPPLDLPPLDFDMNTLDLPLSEGPSSNKHQKIRSTLTLKNPSELTTSPDGVLTNKRNSELSMVCTSDESAEQNLNDFEAATSAQIGPNNICPIGSCKGSPFLDTINSIYNQKSPNSTFSFTSLKELSSPNLIAGISTTHLLKVTNSDGKEENLGIVKLGVENFIDGLTRPWQNVLPQRTGIPYTQMVRNEWLGSFLSKIYGEALHLDFKVPEAHILAIPASNFSNLSNPIENPNTNLICSIHKFAPNTVNLGAQSQDSLTEISNNEFSKIAILDILLYNTDRRRHNALIENNTSLIPIDHSLIASAGFQDTARFFWLGEKGIHDPLPQEQINNISNLEWKPIEKQLTEHNPNMDKETLKTLNASLEFLKIGTSLGMTLYEIGSLMFKKNTESLDDGDYTHFAEHCYKEATEKKGDFSKNIEIAIREYLTPCAKLLRDPRCKKLTDIPENIKEGFRTPLLKAMMSTLNTVALDEENSPEKALEKFKAELETEVDKLINTRL